MKLVSIFHANSKYINMKKLLPALFLLAFACNQKQESTPPAPAPDPEPVAAPAPVPEKNPDGTTIKMNDDGIIYENRDGSNKSEVQISGDSTNIEIKRK